MIKIVEERRLMISRQPLSQDAADWSSAKVDAWVRQFKKRLAVRRDSNKRIIQVIDPREPGADKAKAREASWTDFLALFTVDYCLNAGAEDSELLDAIERMNHSELRFWVARLASDDPREYIVVGLEDPPWVSHRWHFLPSLEHPELGAGTDKDDKDMVDHCIVPLTSHSIAGCRSCASDGERPMPGARSIRKAAPRRRSGQQTSAA